MEQLIKTLKTDALQAVTSPEALQLLSTIFGHLRDHFQNAAETHPDAK